MSHKDKSVDAQDLYLERCLRAQGITGARQDEIRRSRVAVAGLGLGSSIFINLVRLGFEDFHVADPDTFERSNINRQRVARESTVGVRKDDAAVQEALSINPKVRVKCFGDGVQSANVRDFVAGARYVVDAVDVFAFPQKLALHEEAARQRIPVFTCGALGFGAAVVTFDPTTPSFAELSGMRPDADFKTNFDRFARFLVPELPAYLGELIERAARGEGSIPFVVPGVEFAAGMVCTELCKDLLGLGEAVRAPEALYFDPVALRFEKFRADYRARPELKSRRRAA